jgi:hypothetical protein
MAELFIGALAASGFFFLVRLAGRRGLSVPWWGWMLTLAAFLYGVFVLEVVVAFLREGHPQGAAVMGTILGFGAVLWAVFLARFVFRFPVPRVARSSQGRSP